MLDGLDAGRRFWLSERVGDSIVFRHFRAGLQFVSSLTNGTWGLFRPFPALRRRLPALQAGCAPGFQIQTIGTQKARRSARKRETSRRRYQPFLRVKGRRMRQVHFPLPTLSPQFSIPHNSKRSRHCHAGLQSVSSLAGLKTIGIQRHDQTTQTHRSHGA